MFQGTIPTGVRSILLEVWRGFGDRDDLWVGCSGNMTIERMIQAEDPATRLHGCDVSVYTCALGWLLSGRPVPYRIREEYHEELGWLEPYLDDGAGTVATVMIGTRFFNDLGKTGPFFERMRRANHRHYPRLWEETKAKLEALPTRLASYYAGDVMQWLEEVVPAGATFASFPPFWHNGYAKMFEGLDRVFEWPAPAFPDLTDEVKTRLIEKAMDRPQWVLGLQQEHPHLVEHLRGRIQASVGSIPIWVYSSGVTSRLQLPVTKSKPFKAPKLGPAEELGDRMTVQPITLEELVGLRTMFMNRRIDPGPPRVSCAVLVDGKVIGAFGYREPKYDPNCAYLMTDFPIGWSRYARLSKLIVMAAISSDAQAAVERVFSRRMFTWATTAFTDNPTAAKYERGVPGVRRTNRTEVKGKPYRYQVNYDGPLGAWTAQEALVEWKRRHGRVLKEAGPE